MRICAKLPNLKVPPEKMKASMKQILHEGLTHLGTGGILAVGTIVAVFAAYLSDDCTILLTRGPHAFFTEHLRVAACKHGVFTYGEKLWSSNFLRFILTLGFWSA